MVDYRRFRVRGGVYFFTVALLDRKANYLIKYISLLTEAMKMTRVNWPFETIALVVLPDHLHAMWQLPVGDNDYSLRWMNIKRKFTRSLILQGVPLQKNRRDEYDLWQKRFWEHTLRNETDYENHANYIHYNPVKHQLVQRVRDWPYSTFHRFVKKGIYPENWCEEGIVNQDFNLIGMGE